MGAGVIATMGRVEEDEGVVEEGFRGWGDLRCGGLGGKQEAEQGEMVEVRGHFRC